MRRLLLPALSLVVLVCAALPAAATPAAPTGAPAAAATTPPEPFGGHLLASDGLAAPTQPGVPPLPTVAAEAWLVADLDTGEVLAAQAPHRRLRPASTLKVLTALVALNRLDPATPYVATAADASLEGSKVGIVNGGTYTVDQLMLGLLLSSGNDAAHALGQATGGQDVTVGLMNEEARRLGAV